MNRTSLSSYYPHCLGTLSMAAFAIVFYFDRATVVTGCLIVGSNFALSVACLVTMKLADRYAPNRQGITILLTTLGHLIGLILYATFGATRGPDTDNTLGIVLCAAIVGSAEAWVVSEWLMRTTTPFGKKLYRMIRNGYRCGVPVMLFWVVVATFSLTMAAYR